MAAIQDKESILRRLRALIARAEHPNTPAPEAELSRKQAEKLMIKHSIDSAVVGDGESGKARPDQFKFEVYGAYPLDRMQIALAIAEVFSVRVLRFAGTNEYQVFGFETDLDMFWTLWQSLDDQARLNMDVLGGSKATKRSFLTGFAEEVGERLERFYNEVMESAAPGTDIVLADRKDEVEKYMKDAVSGKIRKGRKRQNQDFDFGAYARGLAEGARADIGITKVSA